MPKPIAQPKPKTRPAWRLVIFYNPADPDAAHLSPIEDAHPPLEEIISALWILLRDALIKLGTQRIPSDDTE